MNPILLDDTEFGNFPKGAVLFRAHTAPDIWAIVDAHRIGFQMLTARAKKWAAEYQQPDNTTDFNNMLWVPTPIGSQIIQDIQDETSLNVLLDNWEEPIRD